MKKLLLQSALLAAGFLLLAGCTNVATFDYSASGGPAKLTIGSAAAL